MTREDVETVLRVWLAHREGRIDDMVAEFHRDAVWQPLARPGRSVYVGHAGIRQMVADIDELTGPHRLDLIDIEERSDGIVAARSDLVLLRDGGEEVALRLEFVFELRNGVVVSVDTRQGEPRD